MTTTTNLWAIAGLVYALAGSALLCNAVFFNPAPSGISTSSQSHAMRRLGEQWLDMRIGSVLLVAGFFLQATGALGTNTLNKPAIFVLLGLAFGAALYAMVKDLVVEGLIAAWTPLVRDTTPAPAPKEIAAQVIVASADEASKVVELRANAVGD